MTPAGKIQGLPHVAGGKKLPEKRRDASKQVSEAPKPEGAPNPGYAMLCLNPKCEKVFVSVRTGQRFCSQSCRKAAWFDAHFVRRADAV